MTEHCCQRFSGSRHRLTVDPCQPPSSEPTVVPGVGYLPLFSRGLTILSRTAGAIEAVGKWRFPLRGRYEAMAPYHGAAIVCGDHVLVNDAGDLAVLDIATGELTGRFAIRDFDLLAAAPAGDGLITPFSNGSRFEIGCFRGPQWDRPVWSAPAGAPTRTISVGGGLCCYSRAKGEVAALDLQSGKERWSYSVAELGARKDPSGRAQRGDTCGEIIIWEDRVIVPIAGYHVVGLDASAGQPVWVRKVDVRMPATLTLDPRGVLHLVDYTGYDQFRVSDGAVTVRHDVTEEFKNNGITMLNQVDLSETHLYASEAYGQIFAIEVATGRMTWRYVFQGQARANYYPVVNAGLWHLDAQHNLWQFT